VDVFWVVGFVGFVKQRLDFGVGEDVVADAADGFDKLVAVQLLVDFELVEHAAGGLLGQLVLGLDVFGDVDSHPLQVPLEHFDVGHLGVLLLLGVLADQILERAGGAERDPPALDRVDVVEHFVAARDAQVHELLVGFEQDVALLVLGADRYAD